MKSMRTAASAPKLVCWIPVSADNGGSIAATPTTPPTRLAERVGERLSGGRGVRRAPERAGRARPLHSVLMAWPFDPSVYAGLAVFWAGYLLLARAHPHRRREEAFFGLGVLTIWVALETPIDTVSDCCLQSVHMLQHVLLGV